MQKGVKVNTDNDPVVQTGADNTDNDPVVQIVADNTDIRDVIGS